ncbi:CaiB/BaiF CoA transferase family protein [Skermania piniformis]|uniref:CoA transferase n=1 Tax=Skermania pinensis TaxID=39122 RepID=A0ABX8S5B3_9ACTN|nr:CaiB/BaiF CoA-transferase family protein [Skermania piniformis]QXQ12943.1 CoA transferase [Skermania piniformis]
MSGLLDGVTVVELASWTYVPSAGAALSDWGADVIKVEDVRGGDPCRNLIVGGLDPADSRVHASVLMEIGNHGKRSIGVDIKSAMGRTILGELLGRADVFLTNWLPGPLARAGLTVPQIREFNPDVIIARGSGQGSRGPEKDRGGFDAASYLARAGVAHALTVADQEFPVTQTPAFGDLQGGITLAGGIAAALFHRERTGHAPIVDSSLLAQGMWAVAPDIAAADYFGIDRIPVGPAGTAPNPAVNRYRTRDGRWVQLVLLQADRFWRGFCERIGRPDLGVDERFTPLANLVVNQEAATAELRHTFAEHDLSHWQQALANEPGVWATIATPREVLDDPQAQANGYFLTVTDDAGQQYRTVSAPVQFDETPPPPTRAPEYGEHTEEILLELGMDWDQIIAAKDAGAVL